MRLLHLSALFLWLGLTQCERFTYSYENTKLPQEHINSSFTLQEFCSCSYKCLLLGCRCFQSEKTGNGEERLCHFSFDVEHNKLEQAPGSLVVCKSDYKLVGSNFYKPYTRPDEKLPWEEADEVCREDGGQLPVLNNEEKMVEFWKVVNLATNFDTNTFWLGLRNTEADPQMKWIFQNGSTVNVQDSILAQRDVNTNRCFQLNKKFAVEYRLNNYATCDTPRAFICQRQY